MKIECPCCGDCFTPNEDHLRWPSPEDVNYNDSDKFVWEKIPLLRSLWGCNGDGYNADENNPSHIQTGKKNAGKKQ